MRGEPLVQQALLACAPKEVAVSSVTAMEIAYGLARNPARARRIAPVIEELLDSITTLPYVKHPGSQRAC